MIVPGQFNVSATGGFTYTIPIAVPPGTAGMVPALSLDYSSQNGDGLEGLGWVLSGLPSITRCPRTYAQDNVHGSVNFDANDRFCMEGQRLVLISGTYGANGAQYRTEVEGFSEIISHGQSGSGPAWFEVHTKAGQIMQFGNTVDSQAPLVSVNGNPTGLAGTVRAWAVNSISDTKTNYLTVTYNAGTPDTTNGQVYPTEIDYTGNTTANTQPYNSVCFYYNTTQTRPDIVPTYQTGSLQQTTQLLTEIKTYVGAHCSGTMVYHYELAYTLASASNQYGRPHDELKAVTLCDVNNNCLAPTTFGWQGSGYYLYPGAAAVTTNGLAQGGKLTGGDFNGDGITDAVVISANAQTYYPSCTDDVYFGTGGGAFSQSSMTANYTYWYDPSGSWLQDTYSGPACFNSSSIPANDAQQARPIDIDGDGFTDLLPTEATSGSSQITLAIRNNQSGGLNQIGQVTGIGDYSFGDYNGDGRTDFVGAVFGSGYYTYTSNGDGSFTQGSTYYTNPPVTADFDGDGCSDVAALGPNAWSITYSCAPARPTLTLPNWSSSQVVVGDFNGDGKADFLVIGQSTSTLYLSTGTGLAAGINVTGYAVPGDIVVTGDFNGDGKTDIAVLAPVSGQYEVTVYLSTGTGFTTNAAHYPNGNWILLTASNPTPVVGDWNSDGADDLWIQFPQGDTQVLFSYVPELMTSVSNGIGATTTVTYAPLNKNGSLYTKCPNNSGSFACGDTYPTQGVDGPLYVVSQISSSNGIGGNYVSTYSYGGAKADLHGRGFLGFQSMTVTDPQTGVIQATNYGTAFPLTGLVTSQTKSVGSTTINSTTNTYATQNLGTSLEGVTRNFLELSKSVVASNDLNGAAMPTTTTNYTYDCDSGSACAGTSPTGFGNVVTVNTSVSDGSSKVTNNTYTNDSTNWFLGRLTGTTVTSTVPVGSANGNVAPPVGSINASATTIQQGASTTLTWTSSNATSGSINNGVGGVSPLAGGSVTVTPSATTTYTLSLTGNGGTSTYQVTVTVQSPTVTLSANTTNILQGGQATLSWTSANAATASISGVGNVTPVAGGSVTVSPTSSTTYTITVTNNYNVTATAQVTVSVLTGQFGANPNPIGQYYASTHGVYLSWQSTNATSATIPALNDYFSPPNVANGDVYAFPSTTTTYTLNLTGPAGTLSLPVTVTVVPPPTASFSASPTSIPAGGSSTLSWSTTNTNSVSITGSDGSSWSNLATSGSLNVSPSGTVTYTLTANGTNATQMEAVTVSVVGAPTGVFGMSYTATDIPILVWTSTNATSASISPTYGSVTPVSGGQVALNLNFYGTITYTLTLTGPGGTATYSTQVTGTCPIGGCDGGGGHGCKTCFLPLDPDTDLPALKFGKDEFSSLDPDARKPRTPSDALELIGEGD